MGKGMRSQPETELSQEADRLTGILSGKKVQTVWRHRAEEVGIEFDDGSRLFVDVQPDGRVEISVTNGRGLDMPTVNG